VTLLLLLRPKYVEPEGSPTFPVTTHEWEWRNWPNDVDDLERKRRRRDDDEIALLLGLS